MSKQEGRKRKRSAKAGYSEGIDNVQRNSVFGRYSVGEMIAQLKGLALDPCLEHSERGNIQPLTNQILRLRKIMLLKDSEVPWRKRKLEQFIKDKLIDPSAIVLPIQQNIAKLSRRQLSHVSSLSCLLNSVNSTQCLDEKLIFHSHTSSSSSTFDYSVPEKDASTNSSFLDVIDNLNHPHKDISPSVYSYESANGPNLLSPEKPTHCRSPRLLNFIGDRVQKCVVPVGPRFQADVPEWGSPAVNRNVLIGAYKSASDNSKWLGSKVWPIEIGNMKTDGRTTGKGRLNSCRCVSKGSADCIRLHIHEATLLLQCDIGPAFFSWKFDEMGEQVSKLWSLKQRKAFESLVKTRPSDNGKSLVKRALKCFPNKCGKDIVNYYFNVHIPHRMSLQTRSLSIEQVDTDNEDEADNFNYTDAKDKKARYLRGV